MTADPAEFSNTEQRVFAAILQRIVKVASLDEPYHHIDTANDPGKPDHNSDPGDSSQAINHDIASLLTLISVT